MTHRQLPVTFRLEKSGVISPKNPWKYYIQIIQGGYSSCGHMFWVISSQCPLGGGHLSCWRSPGCERHWGATTIIEELEGLGTVELADFNEPWKKKSANSLLIMEGLGTISMLFFLPLLTFHFFSTKEKAHFVGESQVIRLESKQQARAVERQKKALRAALRPAPGLGDPKMGGFLREFPRPPGVIHLTLYNYIKL